MQHLFLVPVTLRHLLIERRILQKQAAPILGLSQSRLSRILNGKAAVQPDAFLETASQRLCKSQPETEQLDFAVRHDEVLWSIKQCALTDEEREGISGMLRAMQKLDSRSRAGLVANLREVAAHRNLVERLSST